MNLTIGTRLGPYEITGTLGAGGMGEVYRARDTALDRDVAIKVLPESFSADPDRLMRFEREAKTLAALNHPNISQVYGLEEHALVMELAEGDDLSALIGGNAMSLDDVLPIARQIADALEAAHEQGIVHRDLKPANIKVGANGGVKVLDFGLAKAMALETGSGSGATSAGSAGAADRPTTMSPAITRMGMIIGTAAYMSPEQARGKSVDRRADIWAFGAVLFEMLTGRSAFEGDDVSVTLANVIKTDPDWSALPENLPRRLHRLLHRCLEKDPRRRLSAMGDARFELEESDEPAYGSGPTAPTSRARERLAWASGMAAVAVLAAIFGLWLSGPAAESEVVRFEVTLPELALVDQRARPEISPDGRQIAVVAHGTDGLRRVWVKPSSSVEFEPLAGTEGASYPFWSPDSRSLAFFAGGELKRIAVTGGPAETLCVAIRARGGAWSSTGVILFSSSFDNVENLQQVPESGGTPTQWLPSAALPTGSRVRWPHFLPDGRRFLFFGLTREQSSEGIYLGSLDDPAVSMLVGAFSEARYADGQLLFVRDNILVAQPFDDARGELGAGDPTPVL